MQVPLTTGLTLLALGACASTPSSRAVPQEGGPDQRIGLYLGQRSLDEDDWEPVEDQPSFAVEYSLEDPAAPIGWELGIAASKEDDDLVILNTDVDVEGTTQELYGGVRKSFGDPAGTVRPYIGGGLSLITAELEVSVPGDSESADDSSLAAYAHGGLTFDVTDSFFVGVDLRALVGSDLTIEGFDTDADYTQVAVVLGFSF